MNYKKTSSGKTIYKRKIKLSDGTEVEADDNTKEAFSQKKIYPRSKKDPEDGPAPRDKLSKHRYPPPKKDPDFRKHWGRFIENLETREGFKSGHLNLLEILCDLYVEMESLNKFIRTHGRNYKVVTVMGEIFRTYPEVTQLGKVREQIQQYSKHLDLFPKKDKSTRGMDEEEDAGWG